MITTATGSGQGRAERVAGLRVAGGVAGGEPVFALRRRAVGERRLVDLPAHLLLDRVVADGTGGRDRWMSCDVMLVKIGVPCVSVVDSACLAQTPA